MPATLSISVADRGPIAVSVALQIQDPDGISEVNVTNAVGMPVPIPEPIRDCPTDLIEIDLGSMLRSHLPLSVIVNNCSGVDGETTTIFEGVAGPGRMGDPVPSIRLPCSATLCEDNTACNNAQSQATTIRNQMAVVCRRLDEINKQFTILTITLAVMGVLIVVLAATAIAAASVPFGWIIAAVIAIAIGLLSYGIFLIESELKRLRERKSEDTAELSELRPQFRDAVDQVNENCCLHCIVVDLSEPC